MFNAIASLDDVFPDRPPLIIYDIGLSLAQRLELAIWPNVSVRRVPPFVPHWRMNWSWKLYALTDSGYRYVLYLDLANLVVQRSLAPWLLAVQRHGYLLISNAQTMGDITPSDYWASHGLLKNQMQALPTFGAGIIGFDRHSPAQGAIEAAMLRDCICFRADQTLLKWAFRQAFGADLRVRRAARYVGAGGPTDHPSQYVWYARRKAASLVYLYRPDERGSVVRHINRAWWRMKLGLIRIAKLILARSSPPA
jgi:hypothetical protein